MGILTSSQTLLLPPLYMSKGLHMPMLPAQLLLHLVLEREGLTHVKNFECSLQKLFEKGHLEHTPLIPFTDQDGSVQPPCPVLLLFI